MTIALRGVVRSFDAADGLGWLDLDDGREIRLGLTACHSFVPLAGVRVLVVGLEERAGRMRALRVEPDLADEEPDFLDLVWPEVLQEHSVEQRWIPAEIQSREVRVRYVSFDRDAAYVRSPVWSQREDLLPYAYGGEGLLVAAKDPHPFFVPWHESIVASGVSAGALRAEDMGEAAIFGGSRCALEAPWPQCPEHGPRVHILTISADAMVSITGVARALTLHVCVPCLAADRRAWLGRSNAASVALSDRVERPSKLAPDTFAFTEVRFSLDSVAALPPSWLFRPRFDVDGHDPIGGIAAELATVKLLRDQSRALPEAYEEAFFAYDRHYATVDTDILVGGFSPFRFSRCPVCAAPMRQVFFINDYFSDQELPDAFQGSNQLTLLACSRTDACGGPERGLLVLDP
jgi:hypothetical protein